MYERDAAQAIHCPSPQERKDAQKVIDKIFLNCMKMLRGGAFLSLVFNDNESASVHMFNMSFIKELIHMEEDLGDLIVTKEEKYVAFKKDPLLVDITKVTSYDFRNVFDVSREKCVIVRETINSNSFLYSCSSTTREANKDELENLARLMQEGIECSEMFRGPQKGKDNSGNHP